MTAALSALHRMRSTMLYAAALTLGLCGLARGLLGDGPLDEALRVLVLVAFGVLALWLVVVLLGGRTMVEPELRTVRSPVVGRWLALNSPATKVPSHGTRAYGQAYAIDLVAEPEDAKRPQFGTGEAFRRNGEYPAFGEPVRAMVGGVVVAVSDWRRDHRARSNGWALGYMMIEGMVRELGGPGWIVGNHVIVRAEDGTFALVAHLQRRSAAVARGDVVQAGDVIGRCGNSGNSSEPHVHAQLMDRRSLLTAAGVPMAFAGLTIDDGPEPVDGLPADEQHMRASAVAA
ncbi:MAG: M23 family metallopeptidase [Actinomycetaceae bacterium]